MLNEVAFISRALAIVWAIVTAEVRRQSLFATNQIKARLSGSTPDHERDKNIVIVGASFAGCSALRILEKGLPPKSRFRVVVIEPHSHFHFTWVLPRLCVVQGHEHKAFIPYDGIKPLSGNGAATTRWVHDKVQEVAATHVKLQGSGEEIPYEYLIMATGAGVAQGLPSRLIASDKPTDIEEVRKVQFDIEAAQRIVVVGGGAAGVEIAADAKDQYPFKSVTLVHSRSALMNRFGVPLQKDAMAAMDRLGIEVILNDRVIKEDPTTGSITLKSGLTIECDKFVSAHPVLLAILETELVPQINCTGQRPSSGALMNLVPAVVSPSGHVRVKPTLQIADDSLPNIFACGDVIETDLPNPSGRSAAVQASVVSDNILQSVQGLEPSHVYSHGYQSMIKLTLGLVSNVFLLKAL